MHSHEFKFDAYGLNLRMHSHEFLFPCQIFGVFWLVPPMSDHPESGMPLEYLRMRSRRDFGCTPYNHTWVPPKSIVERFRALLRDLRFWANFLVFRIEKNLDLRRLNAYQRKRGDWTPQSNRLYGHPEWVWNDKNNCIIGDYHAEHDVR